MAAMKVLVVLMCVVAGCWACSNPCTSPIITVNGKKVDARKIGSPKPPPGAPARRISAAADGNFLKASKEDTQIRSAMATRRTIRPVTYRRPYFADACPEVNHFRKVYWVKDLRGQWAALVHHHNNHQLLSWVTCRQRSCNPAVVRGPSRCVIRYKYQKVLVWKRYGHRWVHKFIWIKLPGCCKCQGYIFPHIRNPGPFLLHRKAV